MSLAFSDTTTKKGIIQTIERMIFPNNPAKISGNSVLLADFTAEINLAVDAAHAIIIPASGTWQYDDSNHSGEAQITANLVQGTRSYSILSDASSNLALEVYKVFILPSATATQYVEIYPIDAKSDQDTASFYDAQDTQGVPYRYDKQGMKISLDPIPSYAATNGFKVIIGREGSYFTTADTTKKPGFAGIFHEYLALRPAYLYASRNALPTAEALLNELLLMERKMREFYGKRARDERTILTPRLEPYV